MINKREIKLNRIIKFRAWDKKSKKWLSSQYTEINGNGEIYFNDFPAKRTFEEDNLDIEIQLWTGLHDKNGKEIYEFMELDNKYEVIYQAPSYVLKDIATGDIIQLYDNKHSITKEYSKI